MEWTTFEIPKPKTEPEWDAETYAELGGYVVCEIVPGVRVSATTDGVEQRFWINGCGPLTNAQRWTLMRALNGDGLDEAAGVQR